MKHLLWCFIGVQRRGPGLKTQTRPCWRRRWRAGVLEGKSATTKREVVPLEHPPIDSMRAGYSGIDAQNAMLVDNGSIIAGGGVMLCIDATLYILETCLGPEVAAETARIMEYSRARKAKSEQFPSIINDSAHDGRDRVKQRRRADSH